MSEKKGLGEMFKEWFRGIKEKLNTKKGRYVMSMVLTGIGLAIVVVAAGVILFSRADYRKAEKLYENTKLEYVILPEGNKELDASSSIEEKNTQNSQADSQADASQQDDTNWWELMRVDLTRLSRNYPDVVGWIAFENVDISYPVVYSGDDEKYLRTTYTGTRANAGSIFLEGENEPDFSDQHTLIYGHNMHDLTMFGRLKYYVSQEGYLENHQYFQIFANNEIYRYQIFAVEEVSETSSIYNVYRSDSEGIRNLVNTIIKGAYKRADIPVGTNDHIITLSTCTADDEKRLIVSAVRVDERSVE